MPEQAVKTVLKKAVLVAHCDQETNGFFQQGTAIDKRGANAQ